MPKKKDKLHITALNEHDRKILDKYTNFHTNFIESNTAENPVLENQNFKGKL